MLQVLRPEIQNQHLLVQPVQPDQVFLRIRLSREELPILRQYLLFLLLLSLALDRDGSWWLRLLAALPLGLGCGALLLAVNVTRPVAIILFVAFFLWLFLLRGKQLKRLKVWLIIAAFTLSMFGAYSRCDQQWFRWEYLHIFDKTPDIPAYNIYVGLNMDSLGSYSEEDMDKLMSYRYQGDAVYAQEQMLKEVEKRLSSGEINFPKLFSAKLAKLMGNDEGGALCPGRAESSGFQAQLSHKQRLLLLFSSIEPPWRRCPIPQTCICIGIYGPLVFHRADTCPPYRRGLRAV